MSALVVVSTVWSVCSLLFFYSRCPPCPAICQSGGRCPRALWSRRHWPSFNQTQFQLIHVLNRLSINNEYQICSWWEIHLCIFIPKIIKAEHSFAKLINKKRCNFYDSQCIMRGTITSVTHTASVFNLFFCVRLAVFCCWIQKDLLQDSHRIYCVENNNS